MLTNPTESDSPEKFDLASLKSIDPKDLGDYQMEVTKNFTQDNTESSSEDECNFL